MILIISHNGGTVNKVIDWIASKGIVVHRINPYLEKVNIRIVELSNDNNNIELELPGYGITAKLSDYTGIWIWHSNMWFDNCIASLEDDSNFVFSEIKKSLQSHHAILVDYFSSFLNRSLTNIIGNYGVQNLNKLSVLLKAKDIGINVPNSYIVSSKEQILKILEKENLITKPFHEVIYPIYNDTVYQNYTSTVSSEDIDCSTKEIFPTLVQEQIEKEFEIRSFFLRDKFYSMAIFSQNSIKTKIDFRNYNFDIPNRNIPITLPLEMEENLKRLFNSLNLNSGSIDLIYTTDNRYIFLEINPVGQFGMVSFPCNYYIEKRIMEILTNE